MFDNSHHIVINGGSFGNQANVNHTSRGMDILMGWVAFGALYNSQELSNGPRCHPGTRIAVLHDIMHWVTASEEIVISGEEGISDEDGISDIYGGDGILWLSGSAGAGKSAIAKRIAQLAAQNRLLLGTFFFSRTAWGRNAKDTLIATLAYQFMLSIPGTRTHIEKAIEKDPAIFHKDMATQIDTLLVEPLYYVDKARPTLIIIDGIDECLDFDDQVSILHAFARCLYKGDLPFKLLLVSRPEQHIVTAFQNEPLNTMHTPITLDSQYDSSADIRLFFSDSFQYIKHTHHMRKCIPLHWPSKNQFERLVRRSSGQFIYAATVVRFVGSIHHRPTTRLDVLLGENGLYNVPWMSTRACRPFDDLDRLYHHIFCSVNYPPLTLRILSLYILVPFIPLQLTSLELVEQFLFLTQGDIQLALVNLPSIVSCDEDSGRVSILHASLADFLLVQGRSGEFSIDVASANADFARCLFQHIRRRDPDSEYFNPRGQMPFSDRILFNLFKEMPALCKHAHIDPNLEHYITSFNIEAFITLSLHLGDVPSDRNIKLIVSSYKMITATLRSQGKGKVTSRAEVDKYMRSLRQEYDLVSNYAVSAGAGTNVVKRSKMVMSV